MCNPILIGLQADQKTVPGVPAYVTICAVNNSGEDLTVTIKYPEAVAILCNGPQTKNVAFPMTPMDILKLTPSNATDTTKQLQIVYSQDDDADLGDMKVILDITAGQGSEIID